MKIIVLCDQLDCISNEGKNIHHDHPNDVCKHSHPAIQRYTIPNKLAGSFTTGTICNSKVKYNYKSLESPSCSVCETPEPDNCINCCHKPKNVITTKDLKDIDNAKED